MTAPLRAQAQQNSIHSGEFGSQIPQLQGLGVAGHEYGEVEVAVRLRRSLRATAEGIDAHQPRHGLAQPLYDSAILSEHLLESHGRTSQ